MSATVFDTHTLLAGAGTETFLLFIQGRQLRDFCAFEILDDPDALGALERDLFAPIARAAERHGHALLLDSLVWRAHPDFTADVERFNRAGVEAMRRFAGRVTGAPVIVSGDVGPRGDGYQLAGAPAVDDAVAYHRPQLEALAAAGVDVVVALTMTSASEAIAITRLAVELDLPVIVSPTVETDGRTPEGLELGDMIARVDEATGGAPRFYAVNCAHPSHLEPALRAAGDRGAPWLERFAGLRVNASRKSHAELDEAETLDRGDPAALAADVARLARDFDLRMVGGCCGTDAEHLERIAAAVS